MKKVLLWFIAVLWLPLASAAQFTEGTNYDEIKPVATKQPEVMEFFSYYCPHCYSFEPVMAQLRQSLPDNVVLRKNHVDFLGRDMGVEMSRAYAIANLLGVEEKMNAAIFDAIQKKRQLPADRNDVRQLFIDNGIPADEFDSAVDSFAVNGKLAQMQRNTAEFNIRGVPTVIVNGKYKVNPGSVKSVEEYIELVTYLTTLK